MGVIWDFTAVHPDGRHELPDGDPDGVKISHLARSWAYDEDGFCTPTAASLRETAEAEGDCWLSDCFLRMAAWLDAHPGTVLYALHDVGPPGDDSHFFAVHPDTNPEPEPAPEPEPTPTTSELTAGLYQTSTWGGAR